MIDCILDRRHAERLSFVVAEREWSGTAWELHQVLTHAAGPDLPSPVHLGRWLRRNEPTLWWDYGVRVKFSRTGLKRQVHLSRREANLIDNFRKQ